MTGPLYYTATGGNTSRSVQDRAADVANVLDFGADPTGVRDSAPAINAAAAVVAAGSTRHKAVYLPTGTYRVNSQINLTACQTLCGDSRGSSVLLVDQAFDPAATAVIYLTAAFYNFGPVLRDLGIQFAQPQDQASRANFKTLAAGGTSGPGGTGIKYPWAIASGTSSMRCQIVRVQISGAWDGITTNNNNTLFFLEDVEIPALDCGLSLGEASGFRTFAISTPTISGVLESVARFILVSIRTARRFPCALVAPMASTSRTSRHFGGGLSSPLTLPGIRLSISQIV